MILIALTALTLSDQPIATAGRDQGHVAAPAAAGEPVAPSITPRAMTTDEQIAAWIGAAPAAQVDMGEGPLDYDAPFEPERRIRGQVSAAIGSHGHQAFGVDVSIPLGESGTVNLHYSQSKGGPGAYYPYGGYFHDGYALRRRPAFTAMETWEGDGYDIPAGRGLDMRRITAVPQAADW